MLSVISRRFVTVYKAHIHRVICVVESKVCFHVSNLLGYERRQ